MTDKIKNKSTEVKTNTVRIWKNLTQLVEAVSLLSITAYSMYGAYHYSRNAWYFGPLLFAAVVVGLIGSQQFLRHLAAQEA